jgi:4-hydroxy-tetrahydrodipicolinate reductase
MTHPIRVGLFGLGKAGREVAGQFLADPAIQLRWAIRGSQTHDEVPLLRGIPIYGIYQVNLHQLLDETAVDFVVDFSSADACLLYADIVAEHGVGIVSAVSTYQQQHLNCLAKASEKAIVLHSPNITLGINFIIIAGKILRKLAPHAGVEVVEEHFREKREVSGTAIRIAELLELDPQTQVNSIRVGGIVGRHEIIFGFPYQTIRLMHDSISRAAFGQGALFALKNLHGRPKGFYTMEQLVSEGFASALEVPGDVTASAEC